MPYTCSCQKHVIDKALQEPKQLPLLQLADERVIFVSNAAAMYLLPSKGNDSEVMEWLEWESSVLRPVLVGYVVSKAESHKKGLVNCLQKLDEKLSSSCSVIVVKENRIQ